LPNFVVKLGIELANLQSTVCSKILFSRPITGLFLSPISSHQLSINKMPEQEVDVNRLGLFCQTRFLDMQP